MKTTLHFFIFLILVLTFYQCQNKIKTTTMLQNKNTKNSSNPLLCDPDTGVCAIPYLTEKSQMTAEQNSNELLPALHLMNLQFTSSPSPIPKELFPVWI